MLCSSDFAGYRLIDYLDSMVAAVGLQDMAQVQCQRNLVSGWMSEHRIVNGLD